MQTYYFLGIGGSAMGQVALLLQAQGHAVSGADNGVYPPMSGELAKAGINYQEGYTVEHVIAAAPDVIVVGNALSRGNPVIEWLLETQAFPITSLPALVGETLIQKRPSIVIAGTHGKTTTTAAVAYLLNNLNEAPGYLLGGVPQDLPAGANIGDKSKSFVIEGDEYDSAFFDKRSKFIHYRPRILALGNLEFDHADIFRDLEDIKRSFRHLIRLVPGNGYILYNGDDEALATLLPVSWAKAYSVGFNKKCDLQILNLREEPSGLSFDLQWQGKPWTRIASPLHGAFNARNLAMAALSAGLSINETAPESINLWALTQFHGVKRRQEVHFENKHWAVVEDFAHHPTAIDNTLQALRKRYPEARLWALFEPRSNTTAGKTFEATLPQALAKADITYIAPLHRAEKLLAHERLDVAGVCQAIQEIKAGNGQAAFFDCYEALLENLNQAHQNKALQDRLNVVIFLSNGAFGGILPQFIKILNADA